MGRPRPLARAMPGLRRPRRPATHRRVLPRGAPGLRRPAHRLPVHPHPTTHQAAGPPAGMAARLMASTTARGYGWSHQRLRPPCSGPWSPGRHAPAATSRCGQAPSSSTSATSTAAASACTPAWSTRDATGRQAPPTATGSEAATAPPADADDAAGHHPTPRNGRRRDGGRDDREAVSNAPVPADVRFLSPRSGARDSDKRAGSGLSGSRRSPLMPGTIPDSAGVMAVLRQFRDVV